MSRPSAAPPLTPGLVRCARVFRAEPNPFWLCTETLSLLPFSSMHFAEPSFGSVSRSVTQLFVSVARATLGSGVEGARGEGMRGGAASNAERPRSEGREGRPRLAPHPVAAAAFTPEGVRSCGVNGAPACHPLTATLLAATPWVTLPQFRHFGCRGAVGSRGCAVAFVGRGIRIAAWDQSGRLTPTFRIVHT